MKRLVYTPKVEVYVKADSGVYDLSPYVTTCSVNRKINQVSAATVTFRNPGMMFTENVAKDPISKKTVVGPVFHPMDPIVISMTRLRDRPIQVFTGYVDKAPYLQLHPGTVTIEASCTLKRLLYTFWDPGLPFLQEWLAAHGWSEGALGGGQGIFNPDDLKIKPGSTSDAGIGRLLFDVLNEIGHWPEDAIYIEKLPDEITEIVANLYDLEKSASRQSSEEFQSLLHKIIGSSSIGGAISKVGGAAADMGETPLTVYCVGVSVGAPHRHLLAAMMVGLVECPCSLDSSIDECGSGFGNCQAEIGQKYGDGLSAGWRQEQFQYYDDPTNVVASAKRFFEECKSADTGQSVGQLCQDVQRSAYGSRYAEVQSDATALLESCRAAGCNTGRTTNTRPNKPPEHNI